MTLQEYYIQEIKFRQKHITPENLAYRPNRFTLEELEELIAPYVNTKTIKINKELYTDSDGNYSTVLQLAALFVVTLELKSLSIPNLDKLLNIVKSAEQRENRQYELGVLP